MSKIEKALQKANTMEGMQNNGNAAVADVEVVGMQGTNLRPYHHDISRMNEPVCLSVADLAETRLIYPGMKQRRATEAFRTIRTTIMRSCVGTNCVVLVTSINERSGASFVARNLAAAFAFDETKTALLVDCHLNAPAHQDLMPSQYQFGLTDYLETDGVKIDEIIHPVGIPRFRVIPAGRRSVMSTEHFDSVRMRDLLGHLKGHYPDRYIVLDVASLSASPDAHVLSEASDLVLLVASYGQATESEIWTAAKSIDERKFLGVVFNDEPELPDVSWN